VSTGGEVFVGRSYEIGALCAALDATGSGNGRMVLLAGEPGIGKTRTASQLTQYAAERHSRIVWGRCHEEAGAPPYWPWIQILCAVATGKDTDELRLDLDGGAADIADMVPDIRARLSDLDPPATLSDPSETRFRLFGSITQFLIRSSRRQPLVLVLDDLHWADTPTLRLLEFLAQELAESRLMLIGIYRDTDLSRQHRLSDTLGALTRIPRVLRLHLSGLNQEDVRQFVTTTAGMAVPNALTTAIHSQTEGNPLFVNEVVRFLAQQGGFNRDALAVPPAIRLPEGIREVIGRRLNLLSRASNQVLMVAAVIGREFTLDILVRACHPRSEEAILGSLDEAIATHIIEELGPKRYQFTHTLVRITLYDELRTGQRRQLHHAVGEALETVHRRDTKPVLADLAHHFSAAGMSGDVERAIDYTTRAGQRVAAALAFEEAINLFQNALDMLDTRDADDPDRRCSLLLLLGDAQRKSNEPARALVSFAAAADIARSRQDYVALAEAGFGYADTAWRNTTHLDSRSALLLNEALDGLSPADVAVRVRVMGSLARDRLHAGKPDEAKALGSEAVAMARGLNDPAALATSLAALADFPWQPHETEQMLAQANEMAEMGERANDLEVALRGHFRRASLMLELGDIPATIEVVETMSRINTRLRQPFFTLFELSLRTTLALARGEIEKAERLIVQNVKMLPHVANDPTALQIFTLRREQGRLRDLGPMVTMFARSNPAATTWQPGLVLLYVELGDLESARAVFTDLAANNFGSIPRDGRFATCIIFLAEVCIALGETAHASALYRLLSPWKGRNIVMGGGTGFWGSSDRFLGLLSTIQGRWLDAERHFVEALAMNERVGAFAHLGHTEHDFAAMLLTRGYPGDAANAGTLLFKAEERAATLGLTMLAAKVVSLRDRFNNPVSKTTAPDNLTSRELEVLRLLAIGRSNADIAVVLRIGQSTVATHVHNILTKTSCANRTEAAAYASRHGLQTN
jgi:DNA-binding CsgD family transcriptional regulator/tetratricopeptide (TPR) repeat protein